MTAQASGQSRRDFITIAAYTFTGLGAAVAAWPFIDQMNPSKDVLALASTEVDISAIEEGQTVTVMWRGKPVFIRHRNAEEIAAAKADDSADLPDPQNDADRVQAGKEQWLIVMGICTHLGCVPLKNQGDFGGWFCPCHGSHYDTSARIRKGPAPRNLDVPVYEFLDDDTVKIG